ncbi:hypothetical protein COOONC_18200 [Cooperia oncophora]
MKSKTVTRELIRQRRTQRKKDNFAEQRPQRNAPPPIDPAACKFDSLKSAEAEYCQAMERAKEINESLEKAKEMNEDYQEEAETENSEVVKAPSEKFNDLKEAEEKYCNAVKESNEAKESSDVNGSNLPNEAIGLQKDCRCFVSRVGRWQCPACCNKIAKTRRGRKCYGKYGKAVHEAYKNATSPRKSQDSDKSSSDDSSDSDFETLSHESFQECTDKISPVEKDRNETITTNNAGGSADNAASNMYPNINVEQQDDGPEDQGIAFRMIEMGFSAEEVFRVVRMHGNNFERCIEEILKK